MSAFELMGGEDGVRRLVDAFYDRMDTDPAAAGIRAMHATNLAESRRKLWMFLVGRLGGPPLYEQERGHPRLRARHLPFAIGAAEAKQWTSCMDHALDACVTHAALREELRAFFVGVADHMRNQPAQSP
ncbi:MAG: group II truncated hemoglobin, partial [Myxococcota bacterium]